MTAALRWPVRGDVDVWQLPVTPASAAAAAARATGVLCAAELERAAEFAREGDRALYVTAHVGMREILARYVDMRPEELVLAAPRCPRCDAAHGGPALPAFPALRLSLSHAVGFVALAVATDPVGIDTERCDAGGADIEAMSAYLHPAERQAIAGHPRAQRRHAFLRCWVRKEAYLKGRGIGLGEDLDRSHVGIGVPGRPTTLCDGWRLVDLQTPATHLAAVALLLPGEERHPRLNVRTRAPDHAGCGHSPPTPSARVRRPAATTLAS